LSARQPVIRANNTLAVIHTRPIIASMLPPARQIESSTEARKV
jgi:hypothetical protein